MEIPDAWRQKTHTTIWAVKVVVHRNHQLIIGIGPHMSVTIHGESLAVAGCQTNSGGLTPLTNHPAALALGGPSPNSVPLSVHKRVRQINLF